MRPFVDTFGLLVVIVLLEFDVLKAIIAYLTLRSVKTRSFVVDARQPGSHVVSLDTSCLVARQWQNTFREETVNHFFLELKSC
jgi:hypothetical protein